MRSRGAFSIIFLEFLSVTKCTIDMNIPELEYVANHLTLKECRWLVASLHFASFEMPAFSVDQKLPEDVSCLKLLVQWNNGDEIWEGKGKTHEDIARRLRQMGRKDLADWLGVTVFHKLAKDVEDVLLNPGFIEDTDRINYELTAFKDIDKTAGDDWTIFDSILYIILIGVIGGIIFTSWRLVILSLTKENNVIDTEFDKDFRKNMLSYDSCNFKEIEEQDLLDEEESQSCVNDK